MTTMGASTTDAQPLGAECVGSDRFGGRWDFAYWGYGNANAILVPADYGKSDGTAESPHRADLAIYDPTTGMWAIDYADNGFGAFDRQYLVEADRRCSGASRLR